MRKIPYDIPVIKSVPAQTVATKAKDDIVIVRRKRGRSNTSLIFSRAVNGDLLLTWWDPGFEIISLGSAKERRARFEQANKKLGKRAAARRKYAA